MGRYSAQPEFCGVLVGKGGNDAVGEFWTDSEGPAADGRILFLLAAYTQDWLE